MDGSFNQKLIELLKKDNRFIDEDGELVKSAVIDNAYKIDKGLVKLLLSDKQIKDKFFDEIEKHWIFNINTFIEFISDKNFLDNSYTRFRNKIGLTIDGKYLKERGEVCLVWPYKDCVLEGGQTKEEEKRKEIFFNEVFAQDEIDRLLDPKVLTNFKRYTPEGEKKVTELKRDESEIIRENLIIKGNNLLAHCLKKQFAGKVKLIYIDPPYNTGGDANIFSYNNNFNHSSWLTFMKNRLETAKDFLRSDGFIAIAIDHAELFYLGTLADDVFGRENRIAIITVQHNPKGRNQAKFFSANSEFMVIYARNISNAEFQKVTIDDDIKATFNEFDDVGKFRYEPFMRARTVWSRENRPQNWYPIYVSKDLKTITSKKTAGYHEIFPITNDGQEMAWKNIKESFDDLNKGDYFIARIENGKVCIYHKYREQQVFKNVWLDKKYQSEFHGTKLLKEIVPENDFSYPKSVYLVLDVIKIITSQDDIILDFFSGSGTTGHAVFELNKEDGGTRKFILVEQLDEHIKICKKRMQYVLKSYIKENELFHNQQEKYNFIYCELMKYNEVYMDKIQAVKTSKELVNLWKEIAEKSFLNWYVNPEMPDEAIRDFEEIGKTENGLEKQKRLLCELLNKNQLYVNLSEIDDKQFNVSKEDKELNKTFYGEDY